jgi:hypothetical protein
MNDKDLNFKTNNQDNVYKATVNFNTAFENLDANINNAVGVNIQESDDIQNFNGNINVQNFNGNLNQVEINNQVSDNNFYNNDLYSNNFVNVQNNTVNVDNNVANMQNNTVNVYNNIETSDNSVIQDNKNINYVPTMKKKKKPSSGIMISKEVKVMAVIVFVLLIVVFVIPYIYDFLKEFGLVITS